MTELKDVITSYNNLQFSDRIVFYTTISNDINISEGLRKCSCLCTYLSINEIGYSSSF